MKAVSLFSGVGGLDAGFERAGFDISMCLDLDVAAQDMCRQRFPGAHVPSCGDVQSFPWHSLKREGVSTLIAGPPCQPFSRASSWINGHAPGMGDDRASLVRYLGEVVEILRPDVVLLENVPSFAHSEHGGLAELLSSFALIKSARYHVSHLVLNAYDFGVPQLRRRFFLVASRQRPFSFDNLVTLEIPKRHVWDVLCDVDVDEDDPDLRLTGKWAELIPSIPAGNNYLYHTGRGGGAPIFGWRTKFWNFLQKLHPMQPSWTLTASPGSATGPFHWRNRRLALSELAALQTLDKELDFSTIGYRAGVRLIGNAVPSLLGQFVAREIANQMFGFSAGPVPEVHKTVTSVAVPEPVPVPRRFMRNDIPKDHPGPGLGPRALALRGFT